MPRCAILAPVSRALVLLAAFVCGWVLMSVEILGGRILAPNFGGDVFTWGSLISTFLVALSVGYLVGGGLSRRNPRLGILALLVGLAGLAVLALTSVKDPLCDAIFQADLGPRLAPLSAALALFAVPGILLGTVSPYCVRLSATHLDSVGATSGALYALSTLGSTLGTLATTFFLIPAAGVTHILFGNAAALLAMAAILGAASRGSRVLLLPLAILLAMAPASAGEALLHSRESSYSRITVSQSGSVRVLRFARKGVLSEESRIDVSAPDRMLNEYTGMMMVGLAFVADPSDALVIGLGGAIVPRALRRHYPTMRIDNVEIDPAVVDVARQFFMFRTDAAMAAIVSDGRVFVKRCRKKYDVVFLDAFQGRDIPFHLKTRQFLEEVKRVLKPGGVVVSNLHRGPRLYSSERQTYHAVFPTEYAFGGTRSGNLILVSSPGAGPPLPKGAVVQRASRLQAQKGFAANLEAEARKMLERADWDPSATVLTDDYAPVEILNQPR